LTGSYPNPVGDLSWQDLDLWPCDCADLREEATIAVAVLVVDLVGDHLAQGLGW
jgi:hypothetical protein